MKDPRTENYLKDGNYQFTFRAKVPIASIDLVAARINPARAHRKIDPDTVTKYGVAMLDGTEFPAIVVFDTGVSLLALCTGLHRLEAAIEAKIDTFDCYVVNEPVDYRRALLTRAINSIEGLGPTQHEQLKQAAEMMLKWPGISTIKETAAAFMLEDSTLAQFIRASAADTHALELGVFDQFCGLSQTLKLAMYGIQNDHNFVGAATVIGNYSLKGGEADAFVAEVKKARTEAAGQAVIAKKARELEQRDQRSKAKHGRTNPSKSSKFIRNSKVVCGMGPGISKLALDGIEDKDVLDAVLVMEELIDLATKAHKALKHRLEALRRKPPPDALPEAAD